MVRMATQGMTEKDLEGGGDYPAPGMYHVSISNARELVDDNYVQLDFTVMAGAPADPAAGDQRGKRISERYYITGTTEEATEKLMKRLARVAVSVGLIDKSQIGQDLDIDFTMAEGRDCVIRVKKEKYTVKKGENAGQERERASVDFLGIWSTDHEEVTQGPKDAGVSSNGSKESFDDI